MSSKLFLVILLFVVPIKGNGESYLGFQWGLFASGGIDYAQYSGGQNYGINYLFSYNDYFTLSTEINFAAIPLGIPKYAFSNDGSDQISVLQIRLMNSSIDTEPIFSGFYYSYGINLLYFNRNEKLYYNTVIKENININAGNGLNAGFSAGMGYSINFINIFDFNMLLDMSLVFDYNFIGQLDNKKGFMNSTLLFEMAFPID